MIEFWITQLSTCETSGCIEERHKTLESANAQAADYIKSNKWSGRNYYHSKVIPMIEIEKSVLDKAIACLQFYASGEFIIPCWCQDEEMSADEELKHKCEIDIEDNGYRARNTLEEIKRLTKTV